MASLIHNPLVASSQPIPARPVPPLPPKIVIMTPPKAPKEVSKSERLQLAIDEYKQAYLLYENNSDPHKKPPEIAPIAYEYGIIPTTLRRRLAGKTRAHREAHDNELRLSPVEEEALAGWILQVTSWNWPPRVELVRFMASEILVDKGDHRPLGKNWVSKFLGRHSELQSRFSQPLDKDRAATHDPYLLLHWFQLVESVIQKYDIQKEDTYNMDEKGSALGGTGKARVICSREDIQVYKTQDGNREWATLIECISADSRLLSMFLILKGKRQMKAWFDFVEDKEAYIAVSENGWTNNIIGLEWFEKYAQFTPFLYTILTNFSRCFEPQTRRTLKGRYRLLILDGHASHISTKVIVFCISNDIILLCLPPHTTHILQPLDVGFFQPLATAYRKHLEAKTRYGGGYKMDKCDFIQFIQVARKNAATEKNIQHAWQKSGLFPINPQVVFDKLRLQIPEPRPNTPPPDMTVTASNGDSISVAFTPANMQQVNQLVQQIKAGNPDPTLPEKLGKACNAALANNILLKSTNNDLVKIDERKKQRADRGQAHLGQAHLLNKETVDKRQQHEADKQFEKQFKSMCHLGPSLFAETKTRSPVKKKTSPVKKKITTLSLLDSEIPLILPLPGLSPPKQQSQRGDRGGRGGRGTARGGKRGGKTATVVQEVVEEESPVRKSTRGRLIIDKKR